MRKFSLILAFATLFASRKRRSISIPRGQPRGEEAGMQLRMRAGHDMPDGAGLRDLQAREDENFSPNSKPVKTTRRLSTSSSPKTANRRCS